jgi:hypothetical protein
MNSAGQTFREMIYLPVCMKRWAPCGHVSSVIVCDSIEKGPFFLRTFRPPLYLRNKYGYLLRRELFREQFQVSPALKANLHVRGLVLLAGFLGVPEQRQLTQQCLHTSFDCKMI